MDLITYFELPGNTWTDEKVAAIKAVAIHNGLVDKQLTFRECGDMAITWDEDTDHMTEEFIERVVLDELRRLGVTEIEIGYQG